MLAVSTEAVTLDFTAEGIRRLAEIAYQVNEKTENIGARRLQTVMEKLVEDISFTAEERTGETLVIDAAFVEQQLAGIALGRAGDRVVVGLNDLHRQYPGSDSQISIL